MATISPTDSRFFILHSHSKFAIPWPDLRDKTMKRPKFPERWDEERVRQVLRHYDQQGEEEAVAEDEAAFEDPTRTVIEVPASPKNIQTFRTLTPYRVARRQHPLPPRRHILEFDR